LLDAAGQARELAEAASRMREDLVAIVSHDLRNPLAAIAMSAELLRSSVPPGDGPAAKQLERISRSAERMNSLISDLLDVATIDAGALSVQLSLHDVRVLLHEATEMLQPLAGDKSIQIELPRTDVPLAVRADKERVLQVLSNLIGNAIKFSHEGSVIRVGASRDGDDARLWVSDSGPGISPEQLPHVFDRYWQAKKDGRLGIGLALSIAKGIVEAHGGRIWAESEVGKGTTFSFTMAASAGDVR
jgi:signal transduction histidine kinase